MLQEEVEHLINAMRAVGTDFSEVEAKSARGGFPRSLRETLSAFANTTGGTVILGVSEDADFAATGLDDAGKTSADLASMCATELDPPVRPVITQASIDGELVVVAEVPELDSAQKPCFVKSRGMSKGSYIRVHDGDNLMSPFEVQMLLANRGQPLSDVEPVGGTSRADLDEGLVSAYVERVRRLRPYAYVGLDADGILRRSNVLVGDSSGQERLSIGGLLALGTYPQQFFPQLTVTFVSYPTERGPDAVGGVRFLDNVTLEGPIPVMARDALSALRRNMRRRSTVAGIGRTDTWEYPEAALREAIVNALVHRDLSSASRGTQIQMEMYPDRLVVRNPGGLFGPVSVAHLTDDGTSSARNSFLLKLLEDVALPNEDRTVCENRGSGIRTMVEALRGAGMSIPRFEDKISSFSVTFPNHALLDDETLEWLSQLNEPGMTDSQCVGLAIMRSGERLDNGKYRAATGVDSRIATSELQDLVTRELVAQVGTRRWTEYQLLVRPPAIAGDPARRRSPRDRRPVILDALAEGSKSRAEITDVTGLNKKVVIRWLKVLRDEKAIRTVGGVSVQNPTVRYERAPESWGQATLDFGDAGE